MCKESNSFDANIKAMLDSNIDMIRNSEFLLLLKTGAYSYNQKLNTEAINMIVDYILARKLFRPDVKAVLKLRKETIYNIKEEVNEVATFFIEVIKELTKAITETGILPNNFGISLALVKKAFKASNTPLKTSSKPAEV